MSVPLAHKIRLLRCHNYSNRQNKLQKWLSSTDIKIQITKIMKLFVCYDNRTEMQ
jgi:hypothetical protein